MKGVGLSIVSGGLYVAGTLIAGPASRKLGPATLNAFVVAGGAIAVSVSMVVAGGPGVPQSGGGVIALLWLGIVISGLAYAMYFAVTRELPSTHVVILGLLEPVIATVIGAVAFHEADDR